MNADSSDNELVQEFLVSRDEELFRMLYRRHTPRLYLFSLRLCAGHHHRAEDVVQETWIRAIQNLPMFEWRSQLSTWLHSIAFNCYREQLTKQTRTESDNIEHPAPVYDLNSSLDLESCVRRLPDGCREVFILHDVQGYTHQEIGSLLNIANGTSKSQLSEARKRLREWLSFHSREIAEE